MDKISVIVPCFNEEDVLPLFYKEVTHVLESIENIDYEILFINYGSHDHSEDILKLLAHKNPHCFYYSFSRNFGKKPLCMQDLKMLVEIMLLLWMQIYNILLIY